MRAFIKPHRVITIRIDAEPEDRRVDVNALPPCETCGHEQTIHFGGRRCTVDGCTCSRYAGKRPPITDEDIARAAGEAVALLVANGVDVVEIEHVVGGGAAYAADAARIAATIETACKAAGVAIESVEVPTVKAAPPPKVAAAVDALDLERQARGASWLACRRADVAAVAVETSHEPAVEVAAPVIVAGVDPGASKLGLVVSRLDPDGSVHFLDAMTLDVGRLVTLATPRVTRRKDGTERVRTETRELGIDELGDIAERVRTVLAAHSVNVLAIEWVDRFYGSPGPKGGAAAYAVGDAGKVATAIAMVAKLTLPDLVVRTIGAREWRHAVTGQADGSTLRDALRKGYGGTWPAKSNEHERDAGGLVLGAIAMPEPERAPDAPKKPRSISHRRTAPNVTGPARPSSTARDRTGGKRAVRLAAERAAARAASGCTCGTRPGRHARACPLAANKAH